MLAYLLAPTSNAPLILFRALFGGLVAIFCVIEFGNHRRHFSSTKILLGFEATRFLKRCPQPLVVPLLCLQCGLAVSLAFGWLLPWSALALCVSKAYFMLLDRCRYNNHDYLIVLLSFLFGMVHAADVALVPRWELLIVQLQVAIVYVFGGIAKINRDWLLRAEPFRGDLEALPPRVGWRGTRRVPSIRLAAALKKVALRKETAFAFCWAGLVFDTSIVFLLFFEVTRPYAVVAYVAFHLIAKWLYGLGIFPYLNLAALALFVTPPSMSPVASVPSSVDDLWFFALYLTLQILVPLRRYARAYLPGRRAPIYAEHNNHFSWTMKLVFPSSEYFDLQLFDRATGEKLRSLDLRTLPIFARTSMVVKTRPRALLLLVRSLEPQIVAWAKEAERDLGVRAFVRVSYNKRPSTLIVDPGVDLRKEPVKVFGTYAWQRFE